MAKANGLDLEIVETIPENGVSPEYLKLNPLGKVPTLETNDFVLTECIAIAVYRESQLFYLFLTTPSRHDENIQLSLTEILFNT